MVVVSKLCSTKIPIHICLILFFYVSNSGCNPHLHLAISNWGCLCHLCIYVFLLCKNCALYCNFFQFDKNSYDYMTIEEMG